MKINVLQQNKISLRKLIGGIALIAGTTIGAGILGIPLVTAQAGFLPAVFASVLVWGYMVITGLLYAEVAHAMPLGTNLFSLAGYTLGKPGKIITGTMFLFLYYCLLVAYFAGGAPLLSHLIGIPFGGTADIFIFGLLFGGIVWMGVKTIDRVNLLLIAGLIGSYVLLVYFGSSEVHTAQLVKTKWSKIWFAFPVLFSSFGYHNVIPSLCTYLERDKKSLRISIIFGTIIALLLYLAWQWMILGSLSQEIIQKALDSGQPITSALQSVTGKSMLFALGQTFAFFALVTSFLGVALSVTDFLNDVLKHKGKRRPLLVLLALLPPGLCAAWNPFLFEKALSIAGGFGEAFLNGLLPALIAWKFRDPTLNRLTSNKKVLGIVAVFAIMVMTLEVLYLTL